MSGKGQIRIFEARRANLETCQVERVAARPANKGLEIGGEVAGWRGKLAAVRIDVAGEPRGQIAERRTGGQRVADDGRAAACPQLIGRGVSDDPPA
jgi:hypothetical protein